MELVYRALDVLAIAVAALAASFVAALIRRHVERLIRVTFDGVIAVVAAVEQAVLAVIDALTRMIDALAWDLATSAAPQAGGSPEVFRPGPTTDQGQAGTTADAPAHRPLRLVVVDASGPLFYCLAAVALLAGDLYLAALRAAPLFGFTVSGSLVRPEDVRIELLAGILYVVTTVVFAAVLFECLGVGRRQPPFGTLEPGLSRTIVVTIAGLGMALSALAASLLFLWGQTAIEGRPDAEVARTFFGIFAPLMVTATGLAFVGARQSVTALRYLVTVLLRWLAGALQLTATVSVRVASAPREVGIAAVSLAATPGQTVWDWMCRFGWAQRLHFEPLPANETSDAGPVADVPRPHRSRPGRREAASAQVSA